MLADVLGSGRGQEERQLEAAAKAKASQRAADKAKIAELTGDPKAKAKAKPAAAAEDDADWQEKVNLAILGYISSHFDVIFDAS